MILFSIGAYILKIILRWKVTWLGIAFYFVYFIVKGLMRDYL